MLLFRAFAYYSTKEMGCKGQPVTFFKNYQNSRKRKFVYLLLYIQLHCQSLDTKMMSVYIMFEFVIEKLVSISYAAKFRFAIHLSRSCQMKSIFSLMISSI